MTVGQAMTVGPVVYSLLQENSIIPVSDKVDLEILDLTRKNKSIKSSTVTQTHNSIEIMAKRKKSKIGTCACCGKEAELTLEHLPPRSIFPKPRPTPLPIHTCFSCNNSTSDLDEKLRVVIGVGAYFWNTKETNALWQDVRRTVSHNKRIKHDILSSARPTNFSTPAGIYLGSGYQIETDPRELSPLILKMAYCLHYYHLGFHVPEDVEEHISWRNDKELLADLQPDLIGGFVGTKEQFCYGYGLANEYEEDSSKYASIFQLIFYRRFVVTVMFIKKQTTDDPSKESD